MRMTHYIKQAWQLMRQNPLFSLLYAVGTALAISFTVIMSVAYYVRLAPIYPEYRRWNTYVFSGGAGVKTEDGSTLVSNFSLRMVEQHLYGLECAQAVSATKDSFEESYWVKPSDGTPDMQVAVRFTDPNFFRVYAFDFTEGAPFTEADLRSGVGNVVITQDLARRLFATDREAVGRTLNMNYADYRVCGVVRAASSIGSGCAADIYLPYSVAASYRSFFETEMLGNYTVTVLLRDGATGDDLRAEIGRVQADINRQHKGEWEMTFRKVGSHAARALGILGADNAPWTLLKKFLPVVLALLLIPALNLSGMIGSRMEERLAEMGVRKAFGARRSELLAQVLWENLLLTLAGGALGLLVAWAVLFMGRSWVFMLFDMDDSLYFHVSEAFVTGEMLFSPTVFAVAFAVCALINLLSALIPAWHSLRQPIVCSLNERKE